MKISKSFVSFALFSCLLIGLTGCSRTPDDIARWEAKGNVEKLIKAFDDPKAEIRIAAAQALGKLKAERAIDPLASLFDDPDTNVVYCATAALLSIGNDSAASHLMLALRLDQTDVRLLAVTGLGDLMQTNAVSELARALGDSNTEVVFAAVHSIGLIGDESGSPALSAQLTSSSEALRLACVAALGKTGGEAGAQGLITALADNAIVRGTAIDSLIAIGSPCIPAVLEALKNEDPSIRSGALTVLPELEAVPTSGPELIWYQLAEISIENETELDQELISTLSQAEGDDLIALLAATGHPVEIIREHAFRAVEQMGEPVTPAAMAAAEVAANSHARKWYNGRTDWNGAPSWRIDLWAALTALNPDFKLDSANREYLKLKGADALRILSAADFSATREYAPLLIDLLDDSSCRSTAQKQLTESGDLSVLPLIAAIQASNETIAGSAAEIVGEFEDQRAAQPLIDVLQAKLDAGAELTTSPFYIALVQINVPAAEPVLQKIRPNSDRSIQVFENQYSNLRVMSAETREAEPNADTDATSDAEQPLTFRLGYMAGHSVGEALVTFIKNEEGNWVPDPALPETRSE